MDVGVEIKNQYRVVEHIGRGGMADVWSARDTRLNRMVAIKTIAHGLSQDVDPVKLFEREAQTIAQLEHPHILPIYDFGEFQGQLYIVMRYVTGGSLEDLLSRGPLPLKEVLRMGEAIARALDYAHSNKVIHLDLKPPNILLDSANTPYLADFGLATVLDREGRAQNPGAGTLLYMAPEQLTADVLDHRADIYAFSIMMFHMLTGQLPFDATTSLALKQLQFQEEIPDLDVVTPDLPLGLTYVLRKGTAMNADDRPGTVLEVVEGIKDVLADMQAAEMGMTGEYAEAGYAEEMESIEVSTEGFESDDMALLEAVDLYSRARHAWSGGRGRFLLGVTHFMLMNGYYMDAEKNGLDLDDYGMQMLLRGALEYDHEIDYWWNKLDDNNRRWVCLHAVRSANAPTRIRAMYRLETLPDADPPQIPKLVAQALQVETNEQAKLAALQVLGTRARLMKAYPSYDIKTEYRGRMLTTMTRIGIQLTPPSVWQEAVYTPEIDLLIAEIALDQGMPNVADFAARIIGRIRSLTAVRYIATQQRAGRPGALRALALVRDEAPSLPPVVSAQGRMYAWLANTWRRLTDDPISIVWRYVLALIGGTLAMGLNVWVTFRSEAIFTLQRWGNTLAVGLMFGVFIGFLVLLADEFSARLRGFWPWWARLLVAGLAGLSMGILTWGQYTSFYLQQPAEWEVMRTAGFGLALGFVAAALFNLRGWQAFLITAIATYIPINAAYRSYQLYEFPLMLSSITGLGMGALIGYSARRVGSVTLRWHNEWPSWTKISLSAALGLVWALASWGAYLLILRDETVRWDTVLLITAVSLVIGLGATLFLNRRNWLAFALTGIGSFAALYTTLNGLFAGAVILPEPLMFVIYYDYPEQIIYVTGALAILIALGGHAFGLFSDARTLIARLRGQPTRRKPALAPVQPVPAADFAGQAPTAPTPPPSPTPAAARKPAVQRGDMVTELDPAAEHLEEEVDLSTQFDVEKKPLRPVGSPPTEMDVQRRREDIEEDE